MAYHSDPDGPVIDKGAFRARIIEVCGIVFLTFIIIFIVGKVLNRRSKRLESAIDSSKIDLQYSPYNYSINNTDDAITYTLWGEGCTSVSQKAYGGDPDSIIEWRKTKDNVLHYANEFDITFDVKDLKDIDITVKLVSENDHNLVLLVFKNTENVYDIVRDIGG